MHINIQQRCSQLNNKLSSLQDSLCQQSHQRQISLQERLLKIEESLEKLSAWQEKGLKGLKSRLSQLRDRIQGLKEGQEQSSKVQSTIKHLSQNSSNLLQIQRQGKRTSETKVQRTLSSTFDESRARFLVQANIHQQQFQAKVGSISQSIQLLQQDIIKQKLNHSQTVKRHLQSFQEQINIHYQSLHDSKAKREQAARTIFSLIQATQAELWAKLDQEKGLRKKSLDEALENLERAFSENY